MSRLKDHRLQQHAHVVESERGNLLTRLQEQLGLCIDNLLCLHLGPIVGLERPAKRSRHIADATRIVHDSPVMLFIPISAHLKQELVLGDETTKQNISLASLPHKATLSTAGVLLENDLLLHQTILVFHRLVQLPVRELHRLRS